MAQNCDTIEKNMRGKKIKNEIMYAQPKPFSFPKIWYVLKA